MRLAEYNVRIACIMLGFVGIVGGLATWFYHLQETRHEEFAQKARRIYTATYTRRGSRGNIYDHDGNLLAGIEHCVDVMVEPRKIPPSKREETLKKLAKVFNVDEAKLRERFGLQRTEVVVRKAVSLARAKSVTQNMLLGIRLIDSQRRVYPKQHLASNILGFLKDGVGAYGIDKVLEKFLRPGQGTIRYEHDRGGRPIPDTAKMLTPPRDGSHVFLTIREPLQHIVETEIVELAHEFMPSHTYAVMADPKTGAILAMAQLPTFNPSDRRTMEPTRWRNKAVSDTFEPGSVMKAVAICGALDYGVVNLSTEIYCEKGIWYYAGRPLRDAGHAFEWLTVAEIIQHSSNIGTGKISALHLGKRRLYQTFVRFGFGQRTGIELPEESRGIFRKYSKWDKLSPTRFPIGQGIGVTPLQMVQAYCALANEGKMMQLHIVGSIKDPNTGQTTYEYKPHMRRQVAKRSAVAAMVSALKLVVSDHGTARKAKVPGYEVAGKTGTSQKWYNGSYEGHGKYVSSFIGFVPADNPAFVLLVVADEPQGKHYGGTVCAPTFSRIAAQALRYLNVTEDTVAN